MESPKTLEWTDESELHPAVETVEIQERNGTEKTFDLEISDLFNTALMQSQHRAEASGFDSLIGDLERTLVPAIDAANSLDRKVAASSEPWTRISWR